MRSLLLGSVASSALTKTIAAPIVLTAPTIMLADTTATITLGTFSGADSVLHELLVDGVSVGAAVAGDRDVSGYAGSTLTVRSTGTNAAGSTPSTSAPVEVPVPAGSPAITSAPTISGTVGGILTRTYGASANGTDSGYWSLDGTPIDPAETGATLDGSVYRGSVTFTQICTGAEDTDRKSVV